MQLLLPKIENLVRVQFVFDSMQLSAIVGVREQSSVLLTLLQQDAVALEAPVSSSVSPDPFLSSLKHQSES
jgi:hypothetical protein